MVATLTVSVNAGIPPANPYVKGIGIPQVPDNPGTQNADNYAPDCAPPLGGTGDTPEPPP